MTSFFFQILGAGALRVPMDLIRNFLLPCRDLSVSVSSMSSQVNEKWPIAQPIVKSKTNILPLCGMLTRCFAKDWLRP